MARATSRDFDCPVCGAPVGEHCRGSMRGGKVDYHMARRDLAHMARQVTDDTVVIQARSTDD